MRQWIQDVRMCLAVMVLSAAGLPAALGQIDVGSNGFDGAFNPTEDIEVDLSQATPGAWNAATGTPGNGVYDANVWAIVFRWTSVNIPANVTVTFKNHPANPPVVWLSQTDITIAGQVILDGAQGHVASAVPSLGRPGPGGFAGGIGKSMGASTASGGFGPGGGNSLGSDCGVPGGGFGSPGIDSQYCGGGGTAYGAAALVPLIGGSGGGTSSRLDISCAGGGGGGGAILLGANASVSVELGGRVSARGGNGGFFVNNGTQRHGGGGSGGGVRMVSDAIVIAGGSEPTVDCRGGLAGYTNPYYGNGGVGRVRLEANTLNGIDTVVPVPSTAAPGAIFPSATMPNVRVLSINGAPVPASPSGGFYFPFVDLIGQRFPTNTVVLVQCRNVSITSQVSLRIAPTLGAAGIYSMAYSSGDQALSTWSVTVPTIPAGLISISANAQLP